VIAVLQGRGRAAGITMVAQQAGAPELAASSLKAALDRDWDGPAAREEALAVVLGLLDRVEAFITGPAGKEAAADAVAVARQVRDQDADLTGPAPALRRGVAKDRRISIEDGDMRHGRKTRSVLFDGYKRHVLRDLDTGPRWRRAGAGAAGCRPGHQRCGLSCGACHRLLAGRAAGGPVIGGGGAGPAGRLAGWRWRRAGSCGAFRWPVPPRRG
jgi:hypothetical protein